MDLHHGGRGHGLKLVVADAPSLVRSNQKDQYYTSYLYKLLSDACRSLFRSKTWLLWQREMRLLAECAYFGVTTLLNRQTLGEEYSNIVQVGEKMDEFQRYRVPSFVRRLAFVYFHLVCPYILEKLLRRLSTWVDSLDITRTRAPVFLKKLSRAQRQRFSKVLNFFSFAVSLASQLHMASFYYVGSYYHMAKRLTGIGYVQIERDDTFGNRSQPYRVLGLLVSIQIVLQLVSYISGMLETESTKVSPSSTQGVNAEKMASSSKDECVLSGANRLDCTTLDMKCLLCLDYIINPAAMTCGHIFCWDCIMSRCVTSQECPVCRSHTEPQHIVLLQNFAV